MANPVALVTGAGRGIGRGIAIALARNGWQVAINYRGDAVSAQETLYLVEQAGSAGMTIQADISVAAERAHLLETVIGRWGQFELLVNNAGMAPRQRVDLLELGEASYDELMAVNLKGPFFLTPQASRLML